MAQKKTIRLMMANPRKMYTAPDGTVVMGNAVVEFKTPLHDDVQLKIAKGVLVETDAEPTGSTYHNAGRPTEPTSPRWLEKRPSHQRVMKAPVLAEAGPFGGAVTLPSPVPTALSQKEDRDVAKLKRELANLRKELAESQGKSADALQAQVDELAEKLTPVVELFDEHGPTLVELLPALGPLASYIQEHGTDLANLMAKPDDTPDGKKSREKDGE